MPAVGKCASWACSAAMAFNVTASLFSGYSESECQMWAQARVSEEIIFFLAMPVDIRVCKCVRMKFFGLWAVVLHKKRY